MVQSRCRRPTGEGVWALILAHSGVTLRALGVYESYFGIIWINESYFGVILIRFQSTIGSHADFNEFMQTTG